MKGPYERLKYDLRRVWECPVCRHRERTPGSVTSCICGCQAKVDPLKRAPMKLLEEGARRVIPSLAVARPPAVLASASEPTPPAPAEPTPPAEPTRLADLAPLVNAADTSERPSTTGDHPKNNFAT